jgi:hypothetical protein
MKFSRALFGQIIIDDIDNIGAGERKTERKATAIQCP